MSRGMTAIEWSQGLPMTVSSYSSLSRSPVRILLVEDESKLRESLAEGLRMEDWTVAAAGTGAEAMHYIDSQHFHLLLLDYMLPDSNAVTILNYARAYGLRSPALIITARTAERDRVAALRAGAADYITKPFSFSDLVARCKAVLQNA